MTTDVTPSTGRSAGRQAGPSLAGPAIAAAGLFVVSLVIGLVFGGSLYTSPFIDDTQIQRFYTDHGTLVRWVAFFQFASALSLGVFTAVLWARLRGLAPGQAAQTYVATVGGAVAAVFLGMNAVVQWAMSHQGVVQSAEVRRGLHYLYFALGGFAHVSAVGVLVAGTSLVAWRAGLLPVWFNATSLLFAGLAVLSTLTFVTEATTMLIPIGRFPTLLWQVAIAYLLPRAARATP